MKHFKPLVVRGRRFTVDEMLAAMIGGASRWLCWGIDHDGFPRIHLVEVFLGADTDVFLTPLGPLQRDSPWFGNGVAFGESVQFCAIRPDGSCIQVEATEEDAAQSGGWRTAPTYMARRRWEELGGRWQVKGPSGYPLIASPGLRYARMDELWRPVRPGCWDYDSSGWDRNEDS